MAPLKLEIAIRALRGRFLDFTPSTPSSYELVFASRRLFAVGAMAHSDKVWIGVEPEPHRRMFLGHSHPPQRWDGGRTRGRSSRLPGIRTSPPRGRRPYSPAGDRDIR